ncbi:acylneuraminate cytidylyltransferase family protein [Azospirillum sp.]|uniref:acylneuraminate cytidylyltransferase family protein n=1 Tax=Azospirillum sp. TaxID=34012 RepID=UPI002D249927|nr:acylneuraminate cytidylyltransferase family protein [Azospirillum sp.]HYD63852.1 acylneuraminate cytidylyltransferase family protein [Azospirillum sp.]
MSRVLAIIPARGGSKGLPNKNVLPVGGKPLIAHSVEHAVQSGVCDRVLITTDSEAIRDAAVAAGAWAPFMREPTLAEDLTPTEPVLKDALERAEAIDGPFDIVVFLQPTDIFRKPEWITRAVTLLKEKPELDSAFAAYKTHKNFWFRTPEGELKRVFDWMAVYGPRQTRTPIYREDTGLACASRASLIKQGRRIGDRVEIIEVSSTESGIDIHDAFDLWLADQAYRYLQEHGGR